MKGFLSSFLTLHINRSGKLALILLLLILFVNPTTAAEQKSGQTNAAASNASAMELATTIGPASVPSGPTAIPVADVATKATEVAGFLQTLADGLTDTALVTTTKQGLSIATVQGEQASKETTRLLQRRPSLPALQAQEQQWQQRHSKYSGWLTALTKRSNELQEELNRLAELQTIWELTLDAEKAAESPGPSLQQIKDTLTNIRGAIVPLNEYLSQILTLQSEVGDGVAMSGAFLAKITQFQQSSMTGTLVQDSPAIWSPGLWAKAMSALPIHVQSATNSYLKEASDYLKTTVSRTLLYVVFFVLLSLLFLSARHTVHKWIDEGDSFSAVVRVFDHPFAAALSVVLLVVTAPTLTQIPASFLDTFQLFALVPMIILVRLVVPARLIPGLYFLWSLFALDTFRGSYYGDQLFGQFFLVLESFIGIALTIWFAQRIKPEIERLAGAFNKGLIQAITGLILFTFAVGFAAAMLGYVRLSLLITPGVIALTVLALEVCAFLQIFTGILSIVFNVWPLRALETVQRHRALLERRLSHFLVSAAIVGLLLRFLSHLGLLTPIITFVKIVLNARIERGVISLSPGDILEFILTVCAAFLLSAVLRFILRENIYPRLNMPQGNSYAVSSLLHYFILAVGFGVAIAVIGVDLTKLSVLSGAFGIGLGFGLQSVVNNFVSGLVLLCERPIHVGDTVEVGNLVGNVRRIGIRASTVHTLQGADIIVPNSQLVSDKVTNWTLSNYSRRIDLPVGLSYGVDPERAIKMLEDVALANQNVLRNPEPVVLMVGYGESSLDFELRVWSDQIDNWPHIRSELAVAIYHAVKTAGMTFPFPQREVRLLKDVEEGELH